MTRTGSLKDLKDPRYLVTAKDAFIAAQAQTTDIALARLQDALDTFAASVRGVGTLEG
jgi:hypothetical protein